MYIIDVLRSSCPHALRLPGSSSASTRTPLTPTRAGRRARYRGIVHEVRSESQTWGAAYLLRIGAGTGVL